MTLYRGPTVPHWKQGQIHGAMMKNCLNSIEHVFLTANVRFIPQHCYLFNFGNAVLCVRVCAFFKNGISL